MRKATTIFLLVLSLTSLYIGLSSSVSPPHRTYRNDIFIPGTKDNPTWYYAVSGEDFMQKWGLLPGDTVAFKIGPNGEDFMNNVDLSMTYVNGITFLNDSTNRKDFQLGWFGLGNNCQNVKFLGNGSKYVYYGFTLWEPKNIGLSWSCVGDLEAAYFISNGNAMGVQLVAIPGVTYPLNYQKFHLHNCKILNPDQEAVYIGYVHYNGEVLIDFTGDSITVRNAGRDGIQTRNTSKTLIKDNDIDSVGMKHDYGHDHGILLGDNINGAIVKNNTLKNIQGIGIWNDGWGTFTYECNNIQAQWWGIMSRNNSYVGTDYTDPQEIGYSKQTVKNNIIKAGNGVTMESYFVAPGKTVTIEAYNNQCVDTFKIATGIIFTNSNNSPTTIPQCTANIPVPLPVHLKYFKGHKEQSNAVLEWEIATEEGFDHFEVQKSANGQNFQQLVKVARQPVTIPLYKVIDACPYPSSYYRLKMIDQDGSFTYSSIVNINISLKPVDYSVYDILGRKVLQRTVLSLQAIKNDLQSMNRIKPGLYFIRSTSGSEKFLKK
jgi:hypothetical protein